MKNIVLLFLFIVVSPTQAQQITPIAAWQEKWENSKNYLLEIAQSIPEDNYNFKPTPQQMSFKEQLLQIKNNVDWLSTTYFSEIEYKKQNVDNTITKQELINLLKTSFEEAKQKVISTSTKELTSIVSFFAGPKSKLQILNLLQDHVTHHRGQLIVYLQLKNIKPPSYSGW